VSYGPFQLGELDSGKVEEVHTNVLVRDLGEKIVKLSGADFTLPLRIYEVSEPEKPKKFYKPKPLRSELSPLDGKREGNRKRHGTDRKKLGRGSDRRGRRG
jgi:23S rRNA pseudouridine2605 synthase